VQDMQNHIMKQNDEQCSRKFIITLLSKCQQNWLSV